LQVSDINKIQFAGVGSNILGHTLWKRLYDPNQSTQHVIYANHADWQWMLEKTRNWEKVSKNWQEGLLSRLGNLLCSGIECLNSSIVLPMQTYRAQPSDAPQYLRQFTPIADILSRQRLRSSSSVDLLVPAVRLSTIGCRAFLVTGARIWNDLPADVTAAPSLHTFRKW